MPLTSGDDYEIRIKTSGDTKGITDTHQALNKLSGQTDSSGNSFLKLSGSVATGQAAFALASSAVQKTVQILGDSVKQYEEAETAQKQLEHSVIGVTHGTQAQLKATNDLADSLSKKGVLDDDVIRSGLAQLSTFGLTNDSVRKLGKSMADLTVNQSGVNATSQDAITSANIMAKALNGNFGALEKMGIHLTQTQRDLIKFGNETQRVDTINQVMAANLRTNQATALETTEGKVAHLRVMYGNIQETVGQFIVNGLVPLAAHLIVVINWLDKHRVVLAIVAGIIAALVIPAFISWAIAAGTAAVATIAATLPVIALGAAIGVLAYLIYTHWQGIKNAFAAGRSFIASAVSGIDHIIIAPFAAALGWIRGLPGMIASALAGIGGIIEHSISGAAKGALHSLHIPGFAVGGFTGTGGVNEIAGVVHKGEYVIPQSGVDQATGLPKGVTNNKSINIGTVVLATPQAAASFFDALDYDTMLVGKGLTPARGQA